MDKFVKVRKRCCDDQEVAERPESSKKVKDDSRDHSHQPEIQNNIAPSDISKSPADNPAQPRLRQYPRHSEGNNHARSFLSAWFDKYEWAEYSQECDAMFCYACRHFSPPGYGNTSDAFIKTGFRRWKKAHRSDGRIDKHQKSQCHKLSSISWSDYKRNCSKKTSVAQDISEAYRTKVKENRHYIKTIGEVIMLTVTQGMAQRGHREGHEDVNPGNVRKILQFVAKHDDVIADRIKNGPKN